MSGKSKAKRRAIAAIALQESPRATAIEAQRLSNESLQPASRQSLSLLATVAAVIGLALLWAYWPTFTWLEHAWRTEPDYSHGYLVLPLAIILLYVRRDSFPGFASSIGWGGLSLLLLAFAMRVGGRLAYMDFVDAWSIVPAVGGAVWLLAGRQAARWAFPAIVFLLLLSPLPYRLETGLSWKLQGVATTLSTAVLRILGFPAVAEGNTIWIGTSQMMVAEACSGLRIFVSMAAFAWFWAAMSTRSKVDGVVILLAALPMAIVANVIRVTLTGVCFYFLDAQAANRAHDWLGILMIGIAAGLLWLVKAFWERLYRPREVMTASESLGLSGA
jgi:exosortase